MWVRIFGYKIISSIQRSENLSTIICRVVISTGNDLISNENPLEKDRQSIIGAIADKMHDYSLSNFLPSHHEEETISCLRPCDLHIQDTES